MPHEVIMPALGMAQDTGLLIAWCKGPGDEVKAGDVLFEVETDKSTMEVEAGHDGYLAELRAEAGENVPVGDVIAVIADEKPDAPVRRSWNSASAGASGADGPPEALPDKSEPEEPQPWSPPTGTSEPAPPSTASPLPSQTNGRILASPKVKRLAAEQGLDLSRLAANGVEQPFHVADLETLKALPVASAAAGARSMHLSASVAADGFEAFREWLALEADEPVPTAAILAAFLTAALRPSRNEPAEEITVAIDTPGGGRILYDDADVAGLSGLKPSEEGMPVALVRDLTATRLDDVRLGPASTPVLTVTRKGDDIAIALEADHSALPPDAAISLVSEFAARLETPLRQLL